VVILEQASGGAYQIWSSLLELEFTRSLASREPAFARLIA
jgi:hypothetical protein